MQLSVPEVAQFLQVSEDTVYRWIRDRDLPASQYNGIYRVNRVWLLEWAHDKGFPLVLDDPDRLPSLTDALQRGGVHMDIPGATKAEVLRACVDRLPLPQNVDRGYLFGMLAMREQQGSTGFGNGIAIPHARGPILLHVPKPLLAVCYPGHPVDFSAQDGKPVSALFIQVTPTIRTHLHLLSRLGRLLQDNAFVALVRNKEGLAGLIERAGTVEAVPGPPVPDTAA